MIRPEKPWFPAKSFGWGWGFPTTWQGVVVLLVWLVAFGVGLVLLLRSDSQGPRVLAILYGILMCVLLNVICWVTGERPRWRWGSEDHKEADSSETQTEDSV